MTAAAELLLLLPLQAYRLQPHARHFLCPQHVKLAPAPADQVLDELDVLAVDPPVPAAAEVVVAAASGGMKWV